MKRTLALAAASTASLVLATEASASQHCKHHSFDRHMIIRAVDAEYHGTRDVSAQDRKDVERFIRCARPKVDKLAMRRYRRAARHAWLERRRHLTGYDSPVLADVPGVPWSFASCVAWRESTNGAGSSNIYGILGAGGQGSLSEQKHAFHDLYVARGVEPWQPWDGCG